MYPELFRIPLIDFPVRSYGLMVFLGALAAVLLLRREATRRGWDPAKVTDIAILTVLCGLAGARLFFFIQFYDSNFRGEPWFSLFKVWEGGLVLYGGIIGGFLVMVIAIWRAGYHTLEYLDAVAPSVTIGIAFGRIGCFLNGCCWGGTCSPDFPLGVQYPEGSPAVINRLQEQLPADVYFHPTQLYSSVAAVMLTGILYLIQQKRLPTGTVAASFFLLYGLNRFLIEMIRGDHGVEAGELTVSQKVSVGIFVAGLSLLTYSIKRREVPVIPKEDEQQAKANI